MRKFHVASDDEIKQGKTTDVYFARTKQILKAKGLKDLRGLAEVTAGDLPREWRWGILCGVEEVARLFEGYPMNVECLPEGTLFRPKDQRGLRVPVLTIEGAYADFCELETPMLGLLCQASGVATMAARIRKIAWGKTLLAFGIRRAHPVLAPMLDRATFIGGFDGVSSLVGAEVIGKEPMGTMPHSLVICLGDQARAWKAFDEVMPSNVPRVALVDTYFDEKAEALMAVEALRGKLAGIRLDTPGSRKGDLPEIVREIRWELDIRGHRGVKIFVSGGVNDENIKELCEAGADGFGVGTSITNAPTIDFAMDLVEVEGKPVAKRGKLGGKKGVWRCERCFAYFVTPAASRAPRCMRCGKTMRRILRPLIKRGVLVAKLPKPEEIRKSVLNQLERVEEI
jgi:nicotinate phosphoribosyltransferase